MAVWWSVTPPQRREHHEQIGDTIAFAFVIVTCLSGPFNSGVQRENFGVEENLTRSSVAEYLSGARVEFILDPLDIGI
jgi:hypothetical protein